MHEMNTAVDPKVEILATEPVLIVATNTEPADPFEDLDGPYAARHQATEPGDGDETEEPETADMPDFVKV